jgi:hypothetical protein
MDSNERVIGAIQEFKRGAEKEFSKIDGRFDRIEDRLHGLEGFKLKVIGGVTAVVAIIQGLAWFIREK